MQSNSVESPTNATTISELHATRFMLLMLIINIRTLIYLCEIKFLTFPELTAKSSHINSSYLSPPNLIEHFSVMWKKIETIIFIRSTGATEHHTRFYAVELYNLIIIYVLIIFLSSINYSNASENVAWNKYDSKTFSCCHVQQKSLPVLHTTELLTKLCKIRIYCKSR